MAPDRDKFDLLIATYMEHHAQYGEFPEGYERSEAGQEATSLLILVDFLMESMKLVRDYADPAASVGDYAEFETVAVGGQACVFTRPTDRSRVMKLYHSPNKEQAWSTARREWNTYTLLERCNVPCCEKLFELDGYPVLVLKRVEGVPLLQAIERKASDADGVVKIILSMVWTIADLHQREVLHLDLKPENLIQSDTTCVVIDFGASVVDQEKQILVGTIPYAAPELRAGVASYASDVYSLGVLLFRIAAYLSVAPETRDIADIAAAIRSRAVVATNKSPTVRYHDAVEMADSLSRAF